MGHTPMKNTQKHTQGPWNVAYYGYTERPVIKHGSQSIADVRGCELDDTTTHSLANARLIAAAPDLLAALRGMVCLYEVMHARNPYTDSRPLQALAAITKAEGVK